MCKVYYFVQAMSYTASISILTVISIERYIAIIYPMDSKRLQTMFLLRATVVGVWTISACSGVPYLVIFDTVDIGTVQFCMMVHPFNAKAYTAISFVLWYLVPLALMTFVYTRISVVLWRSSRGSSELKSSTGGSGRCNGGPGAGFGAGGGGGSTNKATGRYSYSKMMKLQTPFVISRHVPDATTSITDCGSDFQQQNDTSIDHVTDDHVKDDHVTDDHVTDDHVTDDDRR